MEQINIMDPDKEVEKILTRVAEEQEYENPDIKFKQTSSDGANYTSHLYLATIAAPSKEDLRLFIKVAAVGEKMRSIAPFQMYTVESFYYSNLQKIFQDLEERFQVPQEHRQLTPKCYAINDEIYKEALVLEDLTASGYQSYDRFKSVNWEYASKSIQNLTKFHALSIAWSICDPSAFKESANILKMDNNKEALMDYFQNVKKNVLNVTKEENKERLQKFLDDISADQDFFRYNRPIRRAVIAHGDYRPSNLMHKQLEDGTIEIISVDYQTLQIGNPIVDVLYFIFNGSDKDFRKNHFKQTLEHYYSELRAALSRLGMDPDAVYPREDFDYEVEQILPFGLLLGMFCLLIVTVDAAEAPKVTEHMDISDFIVPPNCLYQERINDIIDDYIDMGIL